MSNSVRSYTLTAETVGWLETRLTVEWWLWKRLSGKMNKFNSNIVWLLVIGTVQLCLFSSAYSQSVLEAPEAPHSIVGDLANKNGSVTVSLSWQPGLSSSPLVSYNVYQNNSYLKTVHTNSYTFSVEAGKKYVYRITAKDENGLRSQRSDIFTINSDDTGVSTEQGPAAPTNLRGTVDTVNGVTRISLEWTAPVGSRDIVSYNVYENDKYVWTVTDTRYEKEIVADGTYTYKVTAKDDSGKRSSRSESLLIDQSVNTSQLTAELSAARVAPPTNLQGWISTDGGISTVHLQWTAPDDNREIVGYNVYRDNQYLKTVQRRNYSFTTPTQTVSSYYVTAFDELRNYSLRSTRITVPDVGNRPPEFQGLEDVTVYAGQTLEHLIQPYDPDGDRPGVSVGSLPVGMKFRDNGNGTRVLHWPVLEPQVGEYLIEITLTDAIDTSLKTERSLKVTVLLPDDPDQVRNEQPAIDFISRQIVRAGDEVVMRVKGTDPNGTMPDLQLLNPPPGSTFSDSSDDEGNKYFRWSTMSDDIGEIRLQFKVVDARDPSLFFEREVVLVIVDDTFFSRGGARLRDLADQRGIHIGYASVHEFHAKAGSGIYQEIAAEEYNLVSAENSMKWAYTNPLPGKYRLGEGDLLVEFAAANNMQVHGHTLVWYSALPQWVINTPVQNREDTMNNYIDLMVSRYRHKVSVWDVVNEGLEADGSYRNSIWYEAMGESYIKKAFVRARQNDPDAVLLYNEYDISFPGPKAEGAIALVQGLKNDGVPIDGIGIQMHLDTDFDDFEGMKTIFDRFAAIGVDIYITELDVSIFEGGDEQLQADIYTRILQICLEEEKCKSFQMWGFTDRFSWQASYDPLLFDRQYQPKPAYYSIQRALAGN